MNNEKCFDEYRSTPVASDDSHKEESFLIEGDSSSSEPNRSVIMNRLKSFSVSVLIAAASLTTMHSTASADTASDARAQADRTFDAIVKCEDAKVNSPTQWWRTGSCTVAALTYPYTPSVQKCWSAIGVGVFGGGAAGGAAAGGKKGIELYLASEFSAFARKTGVATVAGAVVGTVVGIETALAKEPGCTQLTQTDKDYVKTYHVRLNERVAALK